MGQITRSFRFERRPAVLWTPWGPILKDEKSPLQVKLRWLTGAMGGRAAKGRAREAAPRQREN